MDGQPVWLCSVSHFDKRGTVATSMWKHEEFIMAERLAHSALKGVGDETKERAFRMNVTFCIHRAVSDEEKAQLPEVWKNAPGFLAGAPVEIHWFRGIPERPAAMPCSNPGHEVLDERRPDLWLPMDCGKCESCKARAVIHDRVTRLTGDYADRGAGL